MTLLRDVDVDEGGWMEGWILYGHGLGLESGAGVERSLGPYTSRYRSSSISIWLTQTHPARPPAPQHIRFSRLV